MESSPLLHSIPIRLNREDYSSFLPNWLGDAVMATPDTRSSLHSSIPKAELTLVGSYVSIEALKYHPQCKRHYVDETKKGGNRLYQYLPIRSKS
jgi:ADP-heptose:LPS heptosyltransferase